MFASGGYQLLIVAAVALLFFGNRLPATMRSLGMSVKSFKEGLREEETEDEVAT